MLRGTDTQGYAEETVSDWQGLIPSTKEHYEYNPSSSSSSSTCVDQAFDPTGKAKGRTKFQCNYCPYTAARKSLLQSHITIHTGEKPYSCPHCPYTARRKDFLVVHVRTHTGEKPYSCNFCSYQASQKSTLNTHLQSHINNSTPEWEREWEGGRANEFVISPYWFSPLILVPLEADWMCYPVRTGDGVCEGNYRGS